MRSKEFITERQLSKRVATKLQFIKDKIDSGKLKDPKTVDYIFKVLNKPEIQNIVSTYLDTVQDSDIDVAAFQKRNNQALADIIRKLPIHKEQLDTFVKRWASGNGFIKVNLLKVGSKGILQQLIPDRTAFIVFEHFENMRTQYSMSKKGTTGYGEFGLAMLSPHVSLKAPGDIEVNGQPIEVKGNDARLYADERTPLGEEMGVSSTPTIQQVVPPAPTGMGSIPPKGKKPMGKPPAASTPAEKKGTSPGAVNNVMASLLQNDPNAIAQAIKAFESRGVENAAQLVKKIQSQGEAGLETLKLEWWKAGFTAYQKAIDMPIMVIGFGQFLISDKAEDFVNWGCLPRTNTNYGYMYGRQVGQSRETYPKIFVPGHNK